MRGSPVFSWDKKLFWTSKKFDELIQSKGQIVHLPIEIMMYFISCSGSYRLVDVDNSLDPLLQFVKDYGLACFDKCFPDKFCPET